MVQPDQTRDPVARLATELRWMKHRLKQLERGSLVVPVLDEDPDADDPTNLWLLNDGRLRGRDAEGRIREWVATAPGSSTSSDPKPAVLTPHLHQQTYEATDSACYCPVHGVEDPLYFGRVNATHGERRVMFMLPDTTADLAGASIQRVELSVRTLEAHQTQVEIAWGAHDEAALGGTYHQRYEDVWRDTWPEVGGDEWRPMPRWFGEALRDSTITGLVVNQPSTSPAYYGRLDTALSLRITYTHAH